MRTTVDLDRPLLERAKRRAAAGGKTLSGIVAEALRSYLGQRFDEPEEPFALVTCGKPGGAHPTPAEIERALEDEDTAARRTQHRRRRANA